MDEQPPQMEDRDRMREQVAQQVLPGVLAIIERDLRFRIVLERVAPGGDEVTLEVDGRRGVFSLDVESWDDYPAGDAQERAQLEIVVRERLKRDIKDFLVTARP